jgi:hypothetical protein
MLPVFSWVVTSGFASKLQQSTKEVSPVVISNRLKQFGSVLSLIAFLVAAHATLAQTQAQSRILAPIQNEERIAVAGSTSPLVKASIDNGRMSGGQNLGRMLLMLSPTPEQDQQAQQLLAALHDASSPSFHKWLTPAQYGE